MFKNCVAILLYLALALLPAAAGAQAFGGDGHCTSGGHVMTMSHDQGTLRGGCNGHGGSHPQAPCTMAGLCAMPGCMALGSEGTADAVPLARLVSFRAFQPPRLVGLSPAPLLEPPRA